MLWAQNSQIVLDSQGRAVLCNSCPCVGGGECGNLPDVLYATLIGDGVTITLNRQSETNWQGSGTANCGDTLNINYFCFSASNEGLVVILDETSGIEDSPVQPITSYEPLTHAAAFDFDVEGTVEFPGCVQQDSLTIHE